jgi:hypothetical protein
MRRAILLGMPPPFVDHLPQGLLLERANVVLPWRAPRSVIATIGSPSFYEAGDRAIYSWSDSVLDGFECTVQFPFITYEPDSFDKAYIELSGSQFADIENHLARVLGPPLRRTDESLEYRLTGGRIDAQVWDHFGPRCTVTIAPP